MPKSDRLEFLRRVEAVRILMISGKPASEIGRQVSQEWGCSERQAERYIRKARDKILAISEVSRAYWEAEHVSLRQYLRLQETRDKNWQGALNVARDEAKLLGLYPPTEVNVNVRDLVLKRIQALGLTRGELLADGAVVQLLLLAGIEPDSLPVGNVVDSEIVEAEITEVE